MSEKRRSVLKYVGCALGLGLLVAAAPILFEIIGQSQMNKPYPPMYRVREYLLRVTDALEQRRRETGALPETASFEDTLRELNLTAASPRDHWGTEIRYTKDPAGHGYELRSAGHDKEFGTWHDIVAGPRIAFITTSRDGRYLSAGLDQAARWSYGYPGISSVKVWDMADGFRELAEIASRSNGGIFYSFALSPDGQRLATSGYGESCSLWDVKTGERIAALLTNRDRGTTWELAFSPDGGRLVAGFSRDSHLRFNYVRVYELSTFTVAAEHHVAPYMFRGSYAFSWDFKFVATMGWHMLRFVEIETGRDLGKRKLEFKSSEAMTISHDSKLLAMAPLGQSRVVLLKTLSGEEVKAFPLGTAHVSSLAFSPDGRLLAVAYSGAERCSENSETYSQAPGEVIVFDVQMRRKVAELPGSRAPLPNVCFAAEGSLLVCEEGYTALGLWDASTFKKIKVLEWEGPREGGRSRP